MEKTKENDALTLFLPNSHSKFKIEWESIGLSESDKLKRVISKYYSFGDIKKIEHVKEWEKMSNNYKVELKNGRIILFRRHIQLKDKSQIEFLNSILFFLGKRGMQVPQILLAKDGSREIFVGAGCYQSFRFIEGNHFSGTEEELKDVAENIARMHIHLAHLPVDGRGQWDKPLLPAWDEEQWAKIFEVTESKTDDLSVQCQKYGPFIQSWLKKVKNKIFEISAAQQQPIHGDLHPQNTIFEDGKMVAILDFEGVRLDSVVRDFANAMHRFVRQYVVKTGEPWEKSLPDGLKIFFDSYSSVNNLANKGVENAAIFIADELLRKLFKDLSVYYLQDCDNGAINSKEFIKKLNLLNEVPLIENYFNS